MVCVTVSGAIPTGHSPTARITVATSEAYSAPTHTSVRLRRPARSRSSRASIGAVTVVWLAVSGLGKGTAVCSSRTPSWSKIDTIK